MTINQGRLLLHNPRCSKSRTTLQMLEESGLDFAVREYLADPLNREELGELQELLGVHPMEWTRTGEPEWAGFGLSPSAAPDEVLDAIASCPKLMQRPILISGGDARIGRPPERILELMGE